MATDLFDGLGGPAGFGENVVARTDDGSSAFIDLTPVMPAGLNFFGYVFTGLWVNNNGSVSFAASMSAFTPTAITGSTANPLITPFWADVDTRSGPIAPSAGGTSSGSNQVWYDLDAVDGVFTVTWDDVGYFNRKTDKANAFQLRLIKVGDAGDFDIAFHYESLAWTTGDFSGGANGLGGTVARAGYSSGNGLDFLELPQSGVQDAVLALPEASNVGTPGTFLFAIRAGDVAARLSIGDARVAEGEDGAQGTVVVPVTLSAPLDAPVTVRYATTNGTAAAGLDYQAQRGVLTFAPGETVQEIRIGILGDRRVEADETFNVWLSAPTGATIADVRGIVTLADDDGLAVADAAAIEGSAGAPGSLVFTVRLLSAATGTVTVDYATADGSAAAGLDYTAATGTLTFAPGETAKTVAIPFDGDGASEGDETFALLLSNAAGAVIVRGSATGTITDDDRLLVDDVTLVEGTATTDGTATVTIRLAGPAEQDVTFDYATEDGTAVAGLDYTATSGSATILAGQTSTTVTVPVLRDAATETAETFALRLSNAAGAAIGDDLATVTLLDDDGFFITDLARVEGTGGVASMVFTVTLASPLGLTTTVDYATADGTATAGLDYTATSGTLTFNAGQTARTFTVPIATDSDAEATETFAVTLSNPTGGAGLRRATAEARILDDDGIAIGDISITEGDAGTIIATATVTLTSSAGTVTVDWTTADGTATAGQDYAAAAGTLTFLAGETSATIEIEVSGDTEWEANETFRIVLTDAAGAAIVDGSGTVTIANDDARSDPVLTLYDAVMTEGTGGASVMRFTAGLSYAVAGPVTVDFATADGTAQAGSDYTATSGTLTIAAGAIAGVIEVPITADAVIEGSETFALTLANPTGGATLGDVAATGRIDDDDARLDLSAATTELAEGDAGTTRFTATVTRSGDLSAVQAVTWTVTPQAAGATAADFAGGVLPRGTLIFGSGQASRSIEFDIAADTAFEPREGFLLRLLNPIGGVTLGIDSLAGAILNDDPLLGTAGEDRLVGSPQDDIMAGLDGNDLLSGAGGADTMAGGDGDDTLLGGAGADSLDGGAGDLDELSYAAAAEGVTVDLGAGTGAGGDAAGDAITGFELVRGGSGADLLRGDAGPNTLFGAAGDDSLEGGEGADRLDGGPGANRMLGGGGNDTFVVRGALDVVVETAGGGADTIGALVALALPDEVEVLGLWSPDDLDGDGNALDNVLIGGAGANRLRGFAGNDRLIGADGDDTLEGGGGADVLIGGSGADLLRFVALTDSQRGARDVVFGFAGGEDVVDLSAIGVAIGGWGSARFVAGAAFTAARQVAWDAAAAELRIEGDGNLATTEMVIGFAAGTILAEGDLLFA